MTDTRLWVAIGALAAAAWMLRPETPVRLPTASLRTVAAPNRGGPDPTPVAPASFPVSTPGPAASRSPSRPNRFDLPAYYDRLLWANEQMARALENLDSNEIPGSLETDLIGLQTDVMLNAPDSREWRGQAADFLDRCGRDSRLLPGVRLLCAANLKRLALLSPTELGTRYAELLATLSDEEAQQLSQVVRFN